jgi:hypothetical protein
MALEEKVEWEVAKQDITADEDFSKPDFKADKDVKKVNLACGQVKREGYIGIDSVATAAADIVHNLYEFPWPFEDDSIYEFTCDHFVEHIPIQLKDGSFGLIRFMEEVWRCLMPGGTIHITAPYYTSMRAWQDPTHTRAITDVTFTYFNKPLVTAMQMDHYSGKCNFEQLSRKYYITPEWEPMAEEARTWAMKHYNNVVADIGFVLRKIEL